MNTRRAGSSGSCTSGSEGGPQKPTRRKPGRALRSDPYTEHPPPRASSSCALSRTCGPTRIVGYSMSSQMTAALAVSALSNAVALLDPAGTTVHSDRGSAPLDQPRGIPYRDRDLDRTDLPSATPTTRPRAPHPDRARTTRNHFESSLNTLNPTVNRSRGRPHAPPDQLHQLSDSPSISHQQPHWHRERAVG
jgi:hypothetical protein